LFAIWISQRTRKSEARRTFIEFTVKQRIEVASELLASLTNRIQLIDEASYWRQQADESTDPKYQEFAKRKMLERLGEPYSKGTARMNDAWAAANTLFSGEVLSPGEAVVRLSNQASYDPAKFDRSAASQALGALTVALRHELLVDEVIRYQVKLFEDSAKKTPRVKAGLPNHSLRRKDRRPHP
jgi:hypothetical protein